MKPSFNRRRFLAAAAAGSVLGAFGEQGLAGVIPGESKLYLPTTSGPCDWRQVCPDLILARDTPGWFLPATISAGSCLLDSCQRGSSRRN